MTSLPRDKLDRLFERWMAIQDELKIPTRFVGTGEKIDDFVPFDARRFVAEMV